MRHWTRGTGQRNRMSAAGLGGGHVQRRTGPGARRRELVREGGFFQLTVTLSYIAPPNLYIDSQSLRIGRADTYYYPTNERYCTSATVGGDYFDGQPAYYAAPHRAWSGSLSRGASPVWGRGVY